MNAKSVLRIPQLTIPALLVFLAACKPLVVAQPTNDVPSVTPLPTMVSSPTLEPTVMPTVSPTLVQTEPLTATAAVPIMECQDAAQYIGDDGLDGTTYAPNTPFTKTWNLKNTGSCTWDSSYLVSQISGTFMTQQPSYLLVPQGQSVAPGQTVDVSVGMTSPVEDGTYRSDWGLQKRNEPFLPIQGGANGNSFYVKIKVSHGGSNAGNIMAASITIEREEGSGTVCTAGATYFVYAYITADGTATANYEINSTAGQIAAGYFQPSPTGPVSAVVTGTLVFDQPDTKTISLRFVGPYPYPDDITVNLRVNGGAWQNTKLSCQG